MIVISLRLYRYGVPYGFNDAKMPKFFAVGGSQLSLWSLVKRQSSFIHSSEKHTRSSFLNKSFRYPESYLVIRRIDSLGCLRLNGITSSISNTIISIVCSLCDGCLVTVIYKESVEPIRSPKERLWQNPNRSKQIQSPHLYRCVGNTQTNTDEWCCRHPSIHETVRFLFKDSAKTLSSNMSVSGTWPKTMLI